MQNKRRAFFAGFQSDISIAGDFRRTYIYRERAGCEFAGLRNYLFQHQAARFGFDRGICRLGLVSQRDGHIVIALRQRDREVKRLVTGAKIAAKGIIPAAIHRRHVRSKVEPVAKFLVVNRGRKNLNTSRRRLP